MNAIPQAPDSDMPATTGADATATPPAAQAPDPRMDRINELYRGEIFGEENAVTARERIHWMCANAIGPRVLDVGCSQGIASILMAREGLTVVGIDSFAPAIEYARGEVARESDATIARLRFELCDVHELGDVEPFDSVIAGEVIEHQTNIDRFVVALARHLRPGGRLILTTPFGLHPHDDHKSVVLPGPLARALGAVGAIESLTVERGYLQAVARAGAATADALDLAQVLSVAEAGALHSQRSLYGKIERREQANAKIKDQLRTQREKVALVTAKVEHARKRTADAEKLLASARTDLQLGKLRLEHATAVHQAAAKAADERIKAAEARGKSAEARVATLTTQVEQATAERDSLTRRLAQQTSALQASEQALLDGRARLAALEQELRAQRGAAVQSAASARELDTLREGAADAARTLASTRKASEEYKRNVIVLRQRLQVLDRLAQRQSQHLDALRESISYRLGNTLVEGTMSWRGLLRVPGSLLRVLRDGMRARRGGTSTPSTIAATPTRTIDATAAGTVPISSATPSPPKTPPARRVASLDEAQKAALQSSLADAFAQGGGPAMAVALETLTGGYTPRLRAFAQLKAAQLCQAQQSDEWAVRFCEAALGSDPAQSTLRGLVRTLWECGNTPLAKVALVAFERSGGTLTGADQDLALNIRGGAFEAIRSLVPLRAPVAAFDTAPDKVLYFLHNSLPFTSGGYATRSHGISTALRGLGVDLVACTRPGYPTDVPGHVTPEQLTASQIIDGVRYRRIYEIGRRGLRQAEYISESCKLSAQVIADERPRVVHAASNYLTGLPPLIAARRAGLPFIYEARGFWEITRSSRDPIFKRSDQYRLMRDLETLVAAEADRVITLTAAMRDELVERGVKAENIAIAYNSVDVERFHARPRDAATAARLGLPVGVPVIGYVGSFVDYEGLDDLITACGILRDRRIEFRLLMVGDGAVFEELQQQVASLDLAGHAILTGRVPHEDVESYYSLIDICPFPRKPWEVCEMVSPLKPFEAMAMEKSVIVSSVRALREIVDDGVTGRVFESGSVEALADALQTMLGDEAQRRLFGLTSRRWVEENRTWRHAATTILDTYRSLGLEVG